MKKFYFSFGSAHNYSSNNGIELNINTALEIEAIDYWEARNIMFGHFGRKWSMQYPEEALDLQYFPQGIVKFIDYLKEKSKHG